MSDDPYVYPGTRVLRNKLNIRDAVALDYQERELVAQRIRQGSPSGDFDLAHLQAIHRHLFQDVYDWAGQVRTVEIAKGGSQFLPQSRIDGGMHNVHSRLIETRYLTGLSGEEFAGKAAEIIGDVNYVHPFREGNGRAQLQYLQQLGGRAGHPIDLTALEQDAWLQASREAHQARYSAMAEAIYGGLGERQARLGLETDKGRER